MQKLISVDLYAHFGFLKKPDINESMYLTYNMLHKPALLGILGAICGLKGYNMEGQMKPSDVPEYRKKLEPIRVGIKPLRDTGGNFSKCVIRYINSVGYASEEEGGILIVDEQTLINPAFRVYLLLDSRIELHTLLNSRLEKREAKYIPYLGKNDHQLWWDNYSEWKFEEFHPSKSYRINSAFLKNTVLKGKDEFISLSGTFMYFERLPIGFQEQLPHYDLQEFVYTDFEWTTELKPEGLIKLSDDTIIQVF